MSEIKRTLTEWEQLKGLEILDWDGFDRKDEKLFERLYTEKEFDNGVIFCTQRLGLDRFCKQYDKIIAEVERLRVERNSYLSKAIIFEMENETHLERIAKLENMLEAYQCRDKSNLKLLEENEQLGQALKKCSPMTDVIESELFPNINVKCCYSCETQVSSEHADNCEYLRLVGGEECE